MASRWLFLLVLAAPAVTEIVDRLVASVGRQALTESDLLREIRLHALLNGAPADFSPSSKRPVLERMIERALIRREMEMSRHPAPEADAVDGYLNEVKKTRFGSEAAYREQLSKYGVREEEFRQYLAEQVAVAGFLQVRFRPGVQVTESESLEYYQNHLLPEWQNRTGEPPPSFEEARPQIEAILAGQRVDRLVDQWLKEARAQTRIEIREKALE